MARPRPLLLLVLAAAAGASPGALALKQPQAALVLAKPTAADEAAKESKMAAVNKVISLLEGLQKKVMDEGEEEASTYNKFACFCKDTTAEKLDAIKKGEDRRGALTTTITKLSERRKELDGKIKSTGEDIAKLEKEIKELDKTREQERKDYKVVEADLASALSALEGALKTLKASKAPTLAQLSSMAQTVGKAALMADALGLGDERSQKVAAFFLQAAPEVPTEDYTFHSHDIISTLEKLQGKIRTKKSEVDAAEVKLIAEYTTAVQAKEQQIDEKNRELDGFEKEKAAKQDEIATSSQELTVVAATLLDDQEYTTELAQMCGDKAKTWDQRTKTRQDELSALTAAIGILKGTVSDKTSKATIRFVQGPVQVRLAEAMVRDPAAMAAVEAATEADEAAGSAASAPLAFLQRLSRGRGGGPAGAEAAGREAVVTLLKSKGALLHSAALTSLASALADDKFAKVKILIEELIKRLKAQAANEASQKGWCDKSTFKAKQKRDQAAQDIKELNGNLDRTESTRDELTEELAALAEEIKDLKDKKKEAETVRGKEKKENEATVKEAEEGLKAVQSAITALEKFYASQKKAEVKLSLAQKGVRGVGDDAPDAGFGAGEAYKGAQEEAGGVIGMLEVIESDFKRTVSETKAAEEQAAQDHKVFVAETEKSVAEKEAAEKEKKKLKDDAEAEISIDTESLKSKTDIIKSTIKELLELREACEGGMSYKERVERREAEMEALKKALCILSKFERYGPDKGLSANC